MFISKVPRQSMKMLATMASQIPYQNRKHAIDFDAFRSVMLPIKMIL